MKMDLLIQWFLIGVMFFVVFITLDHRNKHIKDICEDAGMGEVKATITDKTTNEITLICTGETK